MRNEASRKEFGFVLLVGGLGTLGIFSGVLDHTFVSFDDPDYVLGNEWIRGGLSFEGIVWAFTSLNSGISYWHPLTWISHQIDCEFFGLNAACHKVTSVSLHFLNSCLLYRLLRRLRFSVASTIAVSCLFAWHPLHVESVVWVSERKDVLSTVFAFATFHAYLSFVSRRTVYRYLTVLFLFGCAVMSKPMVVTLPVILILVDVWPLGRLSGREPRAVAWRRLIREKLPLICMSAAVSVLTVIAQDDLGIVRSSEEISMAYRIANALESYLIYFLKLGFPFGLAAFYPYPSEFSAVSVLIGLSFFVGMSALAYKSCKNHAHIAFGWVWYLVSSLPVIGLIQVGGQARADRYTYVPLVGLMLILFGGMNGWNKRLRRVVCIVGVSGFLIFLIPLTVRQVRFWKDSETLYRRAIIVAPTSAKMRLALLSTLDRGGQDKEVLTHLNKAIRAAPDSARVHTVAAVIHRLGGRLELEIVHLRKSLFWDPDQPDLLRRLAYLLSAHPDPTVRRPREAVRLARTAFLSGRGNRQEILDTWAIAEAQAGNFSVATRLSRRAIEMNPIEISLTLLNRLRLFEEQQVFVDPNLAPRNSPLASE